MNYAFSLSAFFDKYKFSGKIVWLKHSSAAETFQSALALSWCATEPTYMDPWRGAQGGSPITSTVHSSVSGALGPLLSHLCYFIGSNARNKAQRSNAAKLEERQDQRCCVQCVPCSNRAK